MTDTQPPESGGFLPPTPSSMPSPHPSVPSSSSTRFLSDLPHPRNRALRPGSNKEDMVRNYASGKLMQISRRYVKKFGTPEPGEELTGYQDFSELCKDLDAVVNVLWLSGTPSLQIQILLRIASEFTEYVPSFPPAPDATLRLLRKLDHCFASLAAGQDFVTKETLPGFEDGLTGAMTTTDMVRCRSTVESTRSLMFRLLGDVLENDTGVGGEEGEDEDERGEPTAADLGRINTEVDRIYENTIIAIGNRLGDGL
ncbi:hypothetical protein jhhlp_006077 [Lomentospora prolificans]|uniref:Meiotic recombination protein DMC1 n=1 Tax=Lomentospora prolificans TaxID=41688 RepID=A0A2N3N4W4_9PEZI|nr:hypothetical protein jhhlp_006077 [Lomentospora prolificans]